MQVHLLQSSNLKWAVAPTCGEEGTVLIVCLVHAPPNDNIKAFGVVILSSFESGRRHSQLLGMHAHATAQRHEATLLGLADLTSKRTSVLQFEPYFIALSLYKPPTTRCKSF